MSSSAIYNPAYYLDTPQTPSPSPSTQDSSKPPNPTMPTAGINSSSYGPGLFVTDPKHSSSIFDNLFKSKTKSKPETQQSDKASMTTTSSSSASTIAEPSPKPLTLLTAATRGFPRHFPKPK